MQRSGRFSFSRMMLNSFPNIARDDPNDVDLSPQQADNLLRHQLSLPHPRYLSPQAFFAAGITGSESLSGKVYRALVKAKLILPVPVPEEGKGRKGSVGSLSSLSSLSGVFGRGGGRGGSVDGGAVATSQAAEAQTMGLDKMTVNTHGISKNFSSQMAVISIHAQRKLVGLLFFWEEECVRWKLLDEEEAEIRHALAGMASVDGGGDGGNVDLRCALAAVEMRKRMLPSKRVEGVVNVTVAASAGGGGGNGMVVGVGNGGPQEELPGYQGRW